MTKNEVQDARDLADEMSEMRNGSTISGRETDLCVRALRHYSSRWRRKAGLLGAVALFSVSSIGLPDVNGDGRADLSDFGAAVRQAVGFGPAVAAPQSAKFTSSQSSKKE